MSGAETEIFYNVGIESILPEIPVIEKTRISEYEIAKRKLEVEIAKSNYLEAKIAKKKSRIQYYKNEAKRIVSHSGNIILSKPPEFFPEYEKNPTSQELHHEHNTLNYHIVRELIKSATL